MDCNRNPTDPEKVWYFAYGSNIKSSVMKSRGIEPFDAKVVCVRDYILTFDVFGLPYAEPSMASISRFVVANDTEPRKTKTPPPVHGVAYSLSYSDFQRLVVTEGGGVAYKEISVSGFTLDKAAPVHLSMTTLTAKYPRRPNAAPSIRYKTLLLEGSEEHDLPREYQDYLASLPSFALGEAWINRIGAKLFLWFGRKTVRHLAKRVRKATPQDGQCPPWYGSLVKVIYNSMWLWHDYIHAPIFGRGDGGGLSYGAVELV